MSSFSYGAAMIIRSDFHDYYDCMLKYDEDRSIVFERHTVVKKEPREPYYSNYYYEDLRIYFCGTIHFGLIDFTRNGIRDVIWSPNKINEIFQERHNNLGNRRQKWDKLRIYEVVLHNLQKTYRQFAPDENVPIWASHSNGMILNPRLANYSFQKAVPPPQAYQQLRMWVSNQAMPEKPLPTVSNSDLIEAKGYNLKTSFRQESSKRRTK